MAQFLIGKIPFYKRVELAYVYSILPLFQGKPDMRNLSVFFLMMALASCSSGVVQTVTKEGGAVAGVDGAKLFFPSGALVTDTTVTITASPEAPMPVSATGVGTPYTFGPEGTTFAKPVTVTLPFDAAKLPAGKTSANIVIYTAPAGSSNYAPLEATVLDPSHVTATTTHFSTFFAGVAKEATGCSVICGPIDGGCQCRATCQSKTYSVACSPAGDCSCAIDGKQTKVVLVETCSNPTFIQQAYSKDCSFPGSVAN